MFAPQVAALAPGVPRDHLGRARLRRDRVRRRAVHLLGLRARLPGAARSARDRAGRARWHVAGRLPVAARRAAGARPGPRAGADRHARPGVEDPERLPAYRQMQQTWLQAGPVDELAERDRRPDHRRPRAERRRGSRSGDGCRARAWAPRRTACSSETTSPTASARSPARRSSFTARPICRSRSGSPRSCAAACPDAPGVVRIEGAPHASNLTHADEVNGPLLDFLRSL